MRTIDRTTQFKKDYKRESKGQHRTTLDEKLWPVIALLASNKTLPPKLCDHALAGEWIDHRDCHIKPDLVLIYSFPDNNTLRLVRLGSHNQLSL